MKLSVDCGEHGLNEEYIFRDDAIKRLESLLDGTVTEIKVVKGSDDGTVNAKEAHKEKIGKSGWHGKIYINNTACTAYKIISLLEEEKVPRICVGSILEAVKRILGFQEVAVTEKDKECFNSLKSVYDSGIFNSRLEVRKMADLKANIHIENDLDEMFEKASRLVEILKEARQIIDSLSGANKSET